MLFLACVALESCLARVPQSLLDLIELLNHNSTELLNCSHESRLVGAGLFNRYTRRCDRIASQFTKFFADLYILLKKYLVLSREGINLSQVAILFFV